jgi:hypothetical protein
MLAPSSEPQYDDLKDNKKSKEVRFKKVKGRLVLLNGKKKVGGTRLVQERLDEMKTAVKSAEAGKTVSTMKDMGDKGYEYKRHGIKSSFPAWFSRLGFNSKKDFQSVMNRKSGPRYERVVNKAIKDLSTGYRTKFGDVPASKKFLVATRQKFDNKNVIFRTINGKVVPMKISEPPF